MLTLWQELFATLAKALQTYRGSLPQALVRRVEGLSAAVRHGRHNAIEDRTVLRGVPVELGRLDHAPSFHVRDEHFRGIWTHYA